MEKSIERIWKEGFINDDALIAPKLNDLYNQKSENFINKYKRMFKLNILLLPTCSFGFLIISFVIGIPYLGIPMFFLLSAMAIVDKKLLDVLNKIDQNKSSYEYLKSFLNWWDHKNRVNILMARILYPYAFFSVIIGLWFMKIKEANLGSIFVDYLVNQFPDAYLVFGIPLFCIIAVFIISSLLLYFSDKMYKWDVNLAYGRVLEKIETLVEDMEELRK